MSTDTHINTSTLLTSILSQLSRLTASPPQSLHATDRTSRSRHSNNKNNNNIINQIQPPHDRQQTKNLLLTLHLLFPNDLLLALDILDRGLVRCYPNNTSPVRLQQHHPQGTALQKESNTLMYLIQSKSSTSTHYIVHLAAWNCTCPAFVLDAFCDTLPPTATPATAATTAAEHGKNDNVWFGGILTQSLRYDVSVPICKHLLACVLLEKCPNLFAREGLGCFVGSLDREVGMDDMIDINGVHELAGWCAG